jgi:hypothetical protein
MNLLLGLWRKKMFSVCGASIPSWVVFYLLVAFLFFVLELLYIAWEANGEKLFNPFVGFLEMPIGRFLFLTTLALVFPITIVGFVLFDLGLRAVDIYDSWKEKKDKEVPSSQK